VAGLRSMTRRGREAAEALQPVRVSASPDRPARARVSARETAATGVRVHMRERTGAKMTAILLAV
jgi:hypothetical protein